MDMRDIPNMIHPTTQIGKNTKIGIYSIIGYPPKKEKCVKIGENCEIGNHVTIYPGVKIMDNVSIKDYSFIDEDAIIGANACVEHSSYIGKKATIGDSTLVLYRAEIYDNAKIGKHCRIGGFVAENTIIGDYVTMFGKLIHSFRDPTHWDGGEEPPIIDDYVVVGFNALIIGGIKVSHHVYIAAGAIVSKDVPPYSIVYGLNKIVPIDEWKGEIKKSRFWRWQE